MYLHPYLFINQWVTHDRGQTKGRDGYKQGAQNSNVCVDLKKKVLALKGKTAQLSESFMMSFHSSKCTSATTGESSGSEPHHRDPGTDLLSLLWAFSHKWLYPHVGEQEAGCMEALGETPCKPVIWIIGEAWRAMVQGLTAAKEGCQATPQILQ